MNDSREQGRMPDISPEEMHEAGSQLLPNGLCIAYVNEIVPFQRTAEREIRESLCQQVQISVQRDRKPNQILQTYEERFAHRPEVLAAITVDNQHLVRELDAMIAEINTLLSDPDTADLQEIARRCEEANKILHSSTEEKKAA